MARVGIAAPFTIVLVEHVDDDVPRLPSRPAMALFDRDRWQRLQPLLDRALDLPDGQRAPWLDELRSTSPEVADELAALLADDEEADGTGFLVDAPKRPGPVFTARALSEWTLLRAPGLGP